MTPVTTDAIQNGIDCRSPNLFLVTKISSHRLSLLFFLAAIPGISLFTCLLLPGYCQIPVDHHDNLFKITVNNASTFIMMN